MNMKYRYVKLSMLFMLSFTLFSCYSAAPIAPVVPEIVIEQSYVIPDPGAVEYVWEPPMIDVVNVPPGLDPEGIYYRPSHQEVVEIRQGRWEYYKPARAKTSPDY